MAFDERVFIPLALLAAAQQRRPLHGAARFATPAEVARAGLTDGDGPGILVGKHQGRFLSLRGQLSVLMAAPTRGGKGVGAVVPTREWRELYTALDGVAVAAIHPFYTASVREFQEIGRPIIGSAPVGIDGVQTWLQDLGAQLGIAADKTDAARNTALNAMRQALSTQRIHQRL